MKKLFLLAVTILFAATAIVSCGSPEKTAQKLIKSNLNKNLKDPSSYEPCHFGSLDSLYSSFEPADKKFASEQEWLKKRLNIASTFGNSKDIKEIRKEMDENLKAWKEAEAAFQVEFIGWEMFHMYHAKNGFKEWVRCLQLFQFDKELTKVIDVVNVSESPM